MATTSKFTFFILLTLQIFVVTLASSSSQEADILLSFKSSLEDPNNSLSTWSNASSSHHCDWQGITCTTTYVTSINLQGLNLSGEISSYTCQLQNLSLLNLAENSFNQPIPLHILQCHSLQTLNLSSNLIWGTIPDQVFELGLLKVLDLSKNHVEGKIPETIGSLNNLQVLNLGSNFLSGNVPNVIGNFTELTVLDLSLNPLLASEIPSDIGKLENLEQLILQGSGFHGEIPKTFVGLKSLRILDLSQNNLSGGLPPFAWDSLEKLVSFDVSENSLVGSFPNGFCNAKGVLNLGLHANMFNGSISDSFSECANLERLQIQDNAFSGDFPSSLWSLSTIKILRAENNGFSGAIPDSMSMATQLEQVQIDKNSFTGKIPQGLGNVKSLYRFSASQNSFYGEIPPNFCDSPVMSIINLSHNALSGQIPEMRKCRKLVSLSLADNRLAGEIPRSLGYLPVLTYLDLSANKLSGSIPQELQSLKLALFNVSFNQLSGRVPFSLISGLPASYLQGNPGLCGLGLPKLCTDYETRRRTAGLTSLTCALISIAFGVSVLIIAAGFFVYHKSSKQKDQNGRWRSVFFYPLRITEQDLIMAMDERSAVGAGGAFGRVYILSLPAGERIAVKKLVNFGSHSSKTLKSEIKTLAKIRHKNIARILGFFHSDESIFMIFEFQPGGSLRDLLNKPEVVLPWSERLQVAIGVAQGLAYLHKDYVPHLLHRNVKSSNILLNAECEPKLTDFGLDRIVGEAAFHATVASECATSCYNAPECRYSKKATEQMDAYSFGVVLLELVTGRQAEQRDSADLLDIVKWVRGKVNIANGAAQALDPKISSTSQQDMLETLDIALRCTSVMPEKRPSISEVVRSLQSLGSRNYITDPDFSTSEDALPV